MTNKKVLEKEIDYLEIKKPVAYKNEYYSVYQELGERINNLKQVLQDLDRLEMLEKKEIPMKPIAHHYEEIGEKPYIKYSCPKCDNKYQLIKNYGKYCPHCGQRLDWSECNDK